MGGGNSVDVEVRATGTRQFERDMGKATSAVGGLRDKALKAGAALSTMGVVGAVGIKKLTDRSRDLETAFAEINTLSGDGTIATDEYREMLAEVSTELGITGGMATTAAAAYQTYSANIAVEDTEEFLRSVSKLSTVGFTTLDEQVNASATLMNVWGQDVDSVSDNADLLMRVVQSTQTELGPFNDAITTVSPVARAAGLTLNETAGTLAFLTDRLGGSKEAATAMRQMIVNLQKPSAEAKKVIQEMGFASFDAAVEQEGFVGASRMLIDTADRMNTPLTDVVGSVEGMAAIQSIAADRSGSLEGKLATLEDRAGTVDKAFSTVSETTDFKLRQAMNELETVTLGLGDALLTALMPTIEIAIDGISRFAEWFRKLSTPVKETAARVAVLITAFSLVAGGAFTAAYALGTILPVLTPLLIPLAAVGLAAAAMATAWKTNFMGIRETTASVMQNIRGRVGNATEYLRERVQLALAAAERFWVEHGAAIKTHARTAYDGARNAAEQAVGLLRGAVERGLAMAKQAWAVHGPAITSAARTAYNMAKDAVVSAVGILRGAVERGLGAVKRLWANHGTEIQTAAGTAWAKVRELIGASIESIKELVSTGLGVLDTIITDSLNIIKGLWETHGTQVKAVIGRLWTGIETVFTARSSIMKSIVGTVLTGIETLWNTHVGKLETIISTAFGVFLTIAQVGLDAILGAWDDNSTAILETVRNVITLITDAISVFTTIILDITSVFLSELSEFWRQEGDTIVEIVSLTVELIVELVNSLINLIRPILDLIAVMWDEWGDEILGVVEFVFDTIANVVGLGLDALKTLLTVALAVLKGDWETAWDAIAQFAEDTFNRISDFVGEWGGVLLDAISDIIDDVVGWFQDLATRLIGGSVIPDMLDDIVGAVVGFGSDFVGAFTGPIDDIVGAVRGMGSDLFRSVDTTVGSIKGLISRGFGAAARVAKSAMGGMKDRIEDIIGGLRDKISGLLDTLGDAKDKVTDTVGDLGGKVGDAVGGVTKTAGSLWDKWGFQHGGVVTSPVNAIIGEGTENEAVLPLSSLDSMVTRAVREASEAGGGNRRDAPVVGEMTVVANNRRQGREAGEAFLRELRSAGLR